MKIKGVCTYVQESYVYSTHTSVQASTFECAMITKQQPNQLCIITVYKPPSSAILIFLEELNLLLTAVSKQFPYHEFYLSGDFNINLLISDCSGFRNSLLAYNLYPKNIYPTHFSSGSSTLIDNIFANFNSTWSSGVVYNDLSDHVMVFISVQRMAADAETHCKPKIFVCTNALLKHIVKQS